LKIFSSAVIPRGNSQELGGVLDGTKCGDKMVNLNLLMRGNNPFLMFQVLMLASDDIK
jgi:hypothetical protein